ncbi:uncharacterized protein LOC124494797 [Dermatophagoides farinae]|uniref:uncharacterized protein LOC124494797 n=1 Tax=Dermatophagoides farinae TaxID=6954 RepID=UPI003F616396
MLQQSSSKMMKKLIENFCFKWQSNETIWPISDRIIQEFSNRIPQLSWSISPAIFKSMILTEETFIERNTTCNLRVGLFPSELQIINNQTYICTIYYEIYMMLLHYYRCRQVIINNSKNKLCFYTYMNSIKFIVSKANFGGYLLMNDSWNGILKMIADKEIDFLPHQFSRNDKRDRILDTDFITPQQHLVTILSHKQHLHNDDLSKLFTIFSLEIWLLISISFIVFLLMTIIADRIRTNDHIYEYKNGIDNQEIYSSTIVNSEIRIQSESEFFRLLRNVCDIFALFMGQGLWKNQINIRRRRDAIQILKKPLIFWILCSFIIRLLFSSNILAVLVSDKEKVIDSFYKLEQLLINNNDYRILMNSESRTGMIFLLKYPHLKKYIVRITNHQLTTWETINKVVNEPYFLIMGRARANLLVRSYRNYDLHVSSEGFQYTLGNMAIRKDLREPEKKILLRLSRILFFNGLLQPIWKKLIYYNLLKTYLNQNLDTRLEKQKKFNGIQKTRTTIEHNNEHSNESTKKRSAITRNMFLFVYFYLIAIIYACIIFILELLLHRLDLMITLK